MPTTLRCALPMCATQPRSTRYSTRRAVATSVAMLLFTTAGAVLFTSSKRQIELGDEFHPPSWPISLRIPRGWEPLDRSLAFSDTIEFREHPASPRTRRLLLAHGDNRHRLSPEKVALRFYRSWSPPDLISLFIRTQATYRPAPFGPFPGAIVQDDTLGFIVAAGAMDSHAYGVGLQGNSPLSVGDQQLAALVFDSIRLVE